MDLLEATLVDELLRDFSGDGVPATPPSLRRHRVPGAPPTETAFAEEEDLEWLSNKDAFPTLDTFALAAPGKLSPPPAAKRPSPVSILDGGGGGFLDAAPPPLFLPRAPGRARSGGRRRRRRALPVFCSAGESGPPRRESRRCWHCGAEETPQWRAGPGGPKTLCNACGVRYKSGRLLPEYRPANSPTFSVDLHSNSHRKVMEMRRMKEGLVVPTPAPATKRTKPKERKNTKQKRGGIPNLFGLDFQRSPPQL